MRKIFIQITLVAALLFTMPFFALAEENAETQEFKVNVTALTDNIYFISDSAGMGNVVACNGDDGLFIVDSKTAFLGDLFKAALQSITKNPVKYLLNSHCHFDHVDGNRLFADTAIIIAHKVTYDYMSNPQQLAIIGGGESYPALTPATGLPDVTFADVLSAYINGVEIQMLHLGPGHTGGDVITIFTEANIIHVADLMFNGMYPYIGIDNGGSINSMIETGAKAAELMDDETRVVPGHGPVTNKAQLLEYNAMLTKIRDNIAAAIANGKSLAEIIAMQPTREFDAQYANGGPLSVEQFVELCYLDLVRFK